MLSKMNERVEDITGRRLSTARLLGYMIFAVVAWELGALISLPSSSRMLITGVVYLLIACVLYRVDTSARRSCAHLVRSQTLGESRTRGLAGAASLAASRTTNEGHITRPDFWAAWLAAFQQPCGLNLRVRQILIDDPGALPHAMNNHFIGVFAGQVTGVLRKLRLRVLPGLGISDAHRSGKLIAAAGDGQNQAGLHPQRLAQHGDVLGQVALFHKGVRPDSPQQFILGDHPHGIQNQKGKNVEGLRRKKDRLSIA